MRVLTCDGSSRFPRWRTLAKSDANAIFNRLPPGVTREDSHALRRAAAETLGLPVAAVVHVEA